MKTAIPLVARQKSDAERNLAVFISSARNATTAFGAGLEFDADCWDVTEFYAKKGHANSKHGTITIHFTQRLRDGGTPFCRPLAGFARAYVRRQLANRSSSSFTYAITAFRALDTSIQECAISSLSDCDAHVFNRAAEVIRSGSAFGDNNSAGSVLAVIARFLDEKGFVYAPLHNWSYPRARKATSGRVGPEFEQRRQAKMPDQAALDGLAQAFHLATEPRDILITSVSAILCSAPERINEVMALPDNCEVEQSGKDERVHLGLRWAGSKGASDHIKWILPGMADVVREALTRIRRITESAREMARWYEHNPAKLYLPQDLEHLRGKELLTLEEVWQIANLSPDKRIVRGWMRKSRLPFAHIDQNHPIRGWIQIYAARFADVERHIVGMLPPGFPMYDERRGMRYSQALLVIPEGLFGNRGSSTGNRCMFEVVKYHHIGCALGQNKHAGSMTVFQRVGIDPEGKLELRSHQFRHWLNTMAQSASLSQLDIAKWSGRANIHHNRSYDHMTSEEIVTKIRDAVGDHAKAIGPLATIPKNLPVARAEFAEMAVPTAHVTLYGFCVHDFTTTPCEMFRKCLDCREHVCIKAIPDNTERIRQALDAARDSLAKAKKAVSENAYGAEDWVTTHQAAVDRLEQLLAILTDRTIADGAIVQLNSNSTYSLSEGALLDRLHLDGTGAEMLADLETTARLP